MSVMTMSPRRRKFALTAHIATSVGWLGTVVVFLVLGLVAMTSRDEQVVRAVYLVMKPAGWLALVPLAFASLISGVIMAVGTSWGLVRHHWVLLKFVINVFANVVLLIYMETISQMAGLAADRGVPLSVVRDGSPVDHSALALLLLIVATGLGVYKPKAMTRYGWRRQRARRQAGRPAVALLRR